LFNQSVNEQELNYIITIIIIAAAVCDDYDYDVGSSCVTISKILATAVRLRPTPDIFTRPILLEVRETMTQLTREAFTSVIGQYLKDAVTTPGK
jgi:hypothetical protein